jgi:hypothetical protein
VRSGFDESAADGVAGELKAVAQAELDEDVAAVAVDGLFAERSRLAINAQVGLSIDDQAQAGASRDCGGKRSRCSAPPPGAIPMTDASQT